jgi:hypothetical protein
VVADLELMDRRAFDPRDRILVEERKARGRGSPRHVVELSSAFDANSMRGWLRP